MKKAGLVLVIIITAFFYASASAEVKWYTLKEGTEKAKAEKKPMLVDFFFGKGCPRCEALQKDVYDNEAIAKKIMDDFIPIRVDLTKKKLSPVEEALGNKYDYKNDCLLLFLDHNGNLIKGPGGKKLRFAEKVGPASFMGYLEFIKGMKSSK